MGKEREIQIRENLTVVSGEKRYTVKYREAIYPEPEGNCYDLMVEDREGISFFPDLARAEEQIKKILKLFTDMKVGSVEAQYIVEDMLADPYWLE